MARAVLPRPARGEEEATLDGRTFADYYGRGNVGELAGYVEAKRANRLNRKNKPTEIRVWYDQTTPHQAAATVVNLDTPDALIAHATLSRNEQRGLAAGGVRRRPYKRPPI